MKRLFIIITMLMVLSLSLSGCVESLQKLNTIALSGEPVPVTFGFEEDPSGVDDGNYWVGTAQITGDDTKYTLTLPEGKTIGSKITENKIILQISGINTKLESKLEDPTSPLKYFDADETLLNYYITYKNVPFYNLDPSRKLISTATITVSLPDGTIKSVPISNSGGESVIRIPVNDETIFFKLQSIQLASGDLPPAGDLSVVSKGMYGYQLVKYDDLKGGVNAWKVFANAEMIVYNMIPTPFKYFTPPLNIDSWDDAYSWMAGNGNIPDRTPPIATSSDIITGTNAKVIINYPTSVFAPLVTFYIPEEIAGSVSINEQTPKFVFDNIGRIEGIEASSYRLEVSGKAEGTGTIFLTMDSPAIKSVSWDGGAEQPIIKGQSYKFYANIEFNTALEADKEFTATVYSDPGGFGYTTQKDFTIYLTDKDTAKTHSVRVYAIYEDSGEKVMSAPLYVDYGADRLIGYGDSTKTRVVEGPHFIYSENITGWYPVYTVDHPKEVGVNGDKSVEILFTKEPIEPKPSLLIPLIVLGLFALIIVLYFSGGLQPVMKFIQPIVTSPYFWIFLMFLFGGLVVLWIYTDITGRIDDVLSIKIF